MPAFYSESLYNIILFKYLIIGGAFAQEFAEMGVLPGHYRSLTIDT